MLSRRRQPDAASESVTPAGRATGIPDASDSAPAITWVGHSTFLIQADGSNVLTDPIWSDRASPVQFAGPRRHSPPGVDFDGLPNIDAVFVSHDHYDHLDNGTVRRLVARYPKAEWITPLGVGAFLRSRGAREVVEMDWWDERTFGGISAACAPAQHFSGRYPWNRNATLWCGWVIGFSSARIFFAGDTGLHPEFGDISRRLGPLDVAILPIGAYEPRWFMRPMHMNPEDATNAYVSLSGTEGSANCVFVPSHWGTFRLTDEPLDEPPRRLMSAWTAARLPESRLRQLQPGGTIRLG